ncbi:DUF1700 domain-containing protein [Gimesia algae]|uniref:Uncharacterized protein n=1 Tax=Gimesia algae TaxID=2527971 RepID=A0A517VIP3_9PLAN|nr:hypothetical protein [Gimesia algae]QDT92865.1 hypothetical protein Pan161_45360 [Gimesia algae]
MVWPEISIEDFPPRRDDEPSSLRQDIIDELSDHFACALNRELLKNSDESLAKQRVIQNFGDPIKIARQLWLDAMKEKIMSQRIMTGISAVMAVCCIAVVGFAWILVQESRVVNQKMLEQLATIADRPQPVAAVGREQQILDQLKELREEQQAAASATVEGMNQISFQLVQDNKDKIPAVGFTGTLIKDGTPSETFTLEAASNAEGQLDFGKLPWGKYQLNLNAPWGESFHQHVSVIPGRNYSQEIICPAAVPAQVPVQFQVKWPGEFNAEDWVLLCDLRHASGRKQQVESSRLIQDKNWIYQQDPTEDSTGVYLINNQNLITACPLAKDGEYKDINMQHLGETTSVKMSQGKHVLPDLVLVQKNDLQRLTELNEKQNYNILNNSRSNVGSYSLKYRAMMGGTEGFGTIEAHTFLMLPFRNAPIHLTQVDLMNVNEAPRYADGIELSKRLVFTASQDEKNLWEIKLPYLENLKMPQRIGGAGQGLF